MKKLLLLILLLGIKQVNAQICFKNPYDFSFNQISNGVQIGQSNSIVADFDNDGKKDVVTTAQGAYFLFFKGLGTGKFNANGQSSNITTFVDDMKEGDFNHDGFLDLALVGSDNQNNPTFQVALGNGTGNFFGSTQYTLSTTFVSAFVTVGDFTNDGFADVVLALEGNNSIGLMYVNNTSGGFTKLNVRSPFGIPTDYNNDGNLDLYADNVMFLGNGNGTFDTTNYIRLDPQQQIASYAYRANIADVTNDGKPDYIVYGGNFFGGNNKIDIIVGGSITATTSQVLHTTSTYTSYGMQLGDVNGDGLKDMVCLYPNYQIEILFNQGNNTFSSGQLISTDKYFNNPSSYPDQSLSEFTVTDINNDHIDDIILPGTKLGVILGNTAKIYPPNLRLLQPYTVSQAPIGITTGDFNKDGKPDFVSSSGGGAFGLNTNLGNGAFAFSLPNSNTSCMGNTYNADFDGDGYLDLVACGDAIFNTTNTNNLIYFNQGKANGLFSNTTTTYSIVSSNSSAYGYDLTIGDFNNDNKPDVVTQNSGSNSVFLNTGNMTFAASHFNSVSGNPTGYAIASADFNKDGNLDFLTMDYFYAKAHLYTGYGNGTFAGPVHITIPAQCKNICVGDFNGDGNKDFACCTANHIYSLLGNGDTTFQAPVTSYGSGQTAYAKDLNNDGKDELIVGNQDGTVRAGSYTSTGFFPMHVFFVGYINNSNIAFADFDLDGRQDMAITDDNNSVVILYNNSVVLPSSNLSLCMGGSIAVSLPNANNVMWNTGSTNNPYIINTPGTYVVTTTNFSGGCSSSDTLVVSTSTLTAPSVSLLAAQNASCVNNAVIQLTGSPAGGTYSGQGVSGNSFNVQQAGMGANIIYYNYVASNGCTNIDSTVIVVDHCVWPGDANEDLMVDNTDLLPIGLKYAATGIARNSISNAWQGYTCVNWNDTLPNGKNIKYTDCDGSGTINFNDTLAVNQNFNLTHANTKYASLQIIQTANPDVYINFNKNLYYPGDTVFAYINIGSTTNQQTNFYGSAFTIHYDYTKVKHGTEKFYFNNSWVGNINQSKIKFSKIFANTGVVDASLTRITHTDTSGYGKVATLQFVLRDTITSNEFYCNINNGIKTNSGGVYTNLNTGTDSVALSQGITSINQFSNNTQLKIYPNPAQNKIMVDATNVVEVKLFDVIGNQITSTKQNQIDVSSFTDGVYFVQVKTTGLTTTQKIIVQH